MENLDLNKKTEETKGRKFCFDFFNITIMFLVSFLIFTFSYIVIEELEYKADRKNGTIVFDVNSEKYLDTYDLLDIVSIKPYGNNDYCNLTLTVLDKENSEIKREITMDHVFVTLEEINNKSYIEEYRLGDKRFDFLNLKYYKAFVNYNEINFDE